MTDQPTPVEALRASNVQRLKEARQVFRQGLAGLRHEYGASASDDAIADYLVGYAALHLTVPIIEADARPQPQADLRAAANYVVDAWADLSQEDCSGTNAMDDAVDRLRAALAAPAADGLDVKWLPLLNLIDQRHIQDVRFGNATGLGEDEVARKANIESDLLRRRIVAALATPEALDVEGKECPMCGGKGRIYDITESMNELMGKGAAMVLPLEPSREPGEER